MLIISIIYKFVNDETYIKQFVLENIKENPSLLVDY